MIQLPQTSPPVHVEKRKSRGIILKSRNFLYVVVGALFFVVGAFLGSFLLKGAPERSDGPQMFAKEPISERALNIGPSVVNLLGDATAPAGHYARVDVYVVFAKKEDFEYGKTMAPVLKDVLLDRLGRLSYTQALDPGIKATLKNELRDRMNQKLDGQLVKEILITEYIIE